MWTLHCRTLKLNYSNVLLGENIWVKQPCCTVLSPKTIVERGMKEVEYFELYSLICAAFFWYFLFLHYKQSIPLTFYSFCVPGLHVKHCIWMRRGHWLAEGRRERSCNIVRNQSLNNLGCGWHFQSRGTINKAEVILIHILSFTDCHWQLL